MNSLTVEGIVLSIGEQLCLLLGLPLSTVTKVRELLMGLPLSTVTKVRVHCSSRFVSSV